MSFYMSTSFFKISIHSMWLKTTLSDPWRKLPPPLYENSLYGKFYHSYHGWCCVELYPNFEYFCLIHHQVVAQTLNPQTVNSSHTSYLSRIPRIYPCKIFLPGVNFYRFNPKNWRFFTDSTRKIGIFDRFYAKKWRFLQI